MRQSLLYVIACITEDSYVDYIINRFFSYSNFK